MLLDLAHSRRSNPPAAGQRWFALRADEAKGKSRVLAFLLLVLFVGSAASEVHAGCHALGEDWYRNYHHGSQTPTIQDVLQPKFRWQPEQRFVYENGEMRAIVHPFPERCQGPQCQEGPTQQNLDGRGVIEQQRNLGVGACATQRISFMWLVPANDWMRSVNLKSLTGFPASLEEPPR
jgi:hypothetical protein